MYLPIRLRHARAAEGVIIRTLGVTGLSDLFFSHANPYKAHSCLHPMEEEEEEEEEDTRDYKGIETTTDPRVPAKTV